MLRIKIIQLRMFRFLSRINVLYLIGSSSLSSAVSKSDPSFCLFPLHFTYSDSHANDDLILFPSSYFAQNPAQSLSLSLSTHSGCLFLPPRICPVPSLSNRSRNCWQAQEAGFFCVYVCEQKLHVHEKGNEIPWTREATGKKCSYCRSSSGESVKYTHTVCLFQYLPVREERSFFPVP